MKYSRGIFWVFILTFIFIVQIASGEDVTIVINSVIGDLKVIPWDSQEISVNVLKRTAEGEIVKEELDAKNLIVKKEGTETKIELEGIIAATIGDPKGYEIYIPENVNLDINSASGAIHIDGHKGKEKISTVEGTIFLRNIVGSVSVKTISGNIDAEMQFSGESKFNTVAGSVDLLIADEFSVPFSVETISGSINVTIPDKYKADVDASSSLGSVSCMLPAGVCSYEFGDKHTMRGKIFGGGPKMKLKSVGGNITIKGAEGIEEVAVLPENEGVVLPQTGEIRESAVPYIDAVRTLDPPDIDGRLDDECWKNAAKVDLVTADGKGSPAEPTQAYMLWDDENLYMGIRCYESRMDDLRISNTENDILIWSGNNVQNWNDDNVQIFIDSTPEGKFHYYHITVNPLSTVIDFEIARAEERRTVETKEGIKWNAGGKIDTDLRKDSWIIEGAIPFSSMNVQPQEGDIWRFNLYRMEQRLKEHSYWAPVYGPADWPHVPEKFGNLVFAGIEPLKKQKKAASFESALTISHIIIMGNDKISREEIIRALGLESGDIADMDNLSQAKRRLEALGWFKNIGMDLTENDKGADLAVKVSEKEIISPNSIQINGSSVFSTEQIADLFNFSTSRTTKEDIDIKCKLVESLYKANGYDMTVVSNSIVSGTLVIDINEGKIDKIEINGNKKIADDDIKESLGLKVGELYKKSAIDSAVYTLKFKLPYFQSVKWRFEKSEDGSNVLNLDVVEGGNTEKDIDHIWDFNRVHGFYWGLDANLENRYVGIKGYTGFRYGFSSEIWDYHFGIEKSFFMKHRFTIGGNVHKITDTNDWELVSDAESKISELILGESWRDLYQRQGYEVKINQEFIRQNTPNMNLGIKYRDDDYRSLSNHNNWSIFNRAYVDDDDSIRIISDKDRDQIRHDIEDKYKPENPPIDEGQMKSVIAEYTIDTRADRDKYNGLYSTFSMEYAGQELGGDYDFNIYQANIRCYNRLSRNQFFAFRLKAATADGELSPYHPRKFYLGGVGTLRGYGFKEFSGDKMVLFNAEYWLMTKWPPGSGLVFFVDTGYAWPYESDIESDDLKTDVGVGFQIGGLRINLASPVNDRSEDTDLVVSVRLARMF